MSIAPFYQHPYVDIFKHASVSEFKNCDKSGPVASEFDKPLGKKIVSLTGPSTSAAYLQIPKASTKGLGLTGKYIYIEQLTENGKNYSIHFDYIVDGGMVTRISLSNIFKQTKSVNNTNIQIELKPTEKWAIVMLRVEELFGKYGIIHADSTNHDFKMSSLSVCGYIKLRGIFTSNIEYNTRTLPKPMSYKLGKEQNFSDIYHWITYPNVDTIENPLPPPMEKPKQVLKNTAMKKTINKENKTDNTNATSELPIKHSKIAPVPKKSQKPKEGIIMPAKVPSIQNMPEEVNDMKEEEMPITQIPVPTIKECKTKQTKCIQPIIEAKPLPKMAPIESEFLLKPDPIMALDKIIGVYANSCRDVKFSCTPKYSESVAFSSSTVLISEDTSSLKQKFFISHSTPVTSIYAFEKYLLTVSSYSENEIIIWEYDCKDKVCMFKPPLSKVIQLAVSYKGTYLLIAGKDMYNREIMVIYNFQELLNQQYEVKMKQISDFNITHISPSPFDETDFVAVGFENIRVWKMKKTILSNSQVPIYENSKKKEFITINYILANELSKTAKCIYVFSKCGIGIQFNLNRNVEKIIKISDVPIFSTHYLNSKQIGIIATESGKITIWNECFKLKLHEIVHVRPLLSLDCNCLQTKLCFMDDEGSIGIVDLSNKQTSIVQRTHKSKIMDCIYNTAKNMFITLSKEGIIKGWDANKFSQEIEFEASSDIPKCLISHPTDSTICAGYESGTIRILDIQNATLSTEVVVSSKEIRILAISPIGDVIAALDSDAKIHLISNNQHFKTIEYNYPSDISYGLSFSYDGAYLANIASNSNTINIWETENYSLKHTIDMAGYIINSICFAASSNELIVLTSISILRVYKVTPKGVVRVKQIPDIHSTECYNAICTNGLNLYTLLNTKDGALRIYDFYFRGKEKPSSQLFVGQAVPTTKMVLSSDNKKLIAYGNQCAFYVWNFYGENQPIDIPSQKDMVDEVEEPHEMPLEPVQQNSDNVDEECKNECNYNMEEICKTLEEIKNEADIAPAIPSPETKAVSFPKYQFDQLHQYGYNINACNNIVGDSATNWYAYTVKNKIVVEMFDSNKTQKIIHNSDDDISSMGLSGNEQYLYASCNNAMATGLCSINIYDAKNEFKLISQLPISQLQWHKICSIDFDINSSLMLILSIVGDKSMISVWNFIEGQMYSKSMIPSIYSGAKWDPYNMDLEFAAFNDTTFNFWRVTKDLSMEYQEGDISNLKKGISISCIDYILTSKVLSTVVLICGCTNGELYITDCRTNKFIASIKISEDPIRNLYCKGGTICATTNKNYVMTAKIQDDLKLTAEYFIELQSKFTKILIDHYANSLYMLSNGEEGYVGTALGSIWFMQFNEPTALKLASSLSGEISGCLYKHYSNANHSLNEANDDSMIAACDEGYLKIWNYKTHEEHMKVQVTKEKCICCAFHPVVPICVGSFTDGYIRFMDVLNSKNLGRCILNGSDICVGIKFLPSGDRIMCCTTAGFVDMIIVERWDPLQIKIVTISDTRLNCSGIENSILEPYNKWLVVSKIGKIAVYSKKFNTAATNETKDVPKFINMDIFNISEFVENNFKEVKIENSLSNYYNPPKVLNVNAPCVDNDCHALFSQVESGIYACFIKKSANIFIRNYELHQVWKRIDIQSVPRDFAFFTGGTTFAVALDNGHVRLQDYIREEYAQDFDTGCRDINQLQLILNKEIAVASTGEIILYRLTPIN